MKLLFNISRFYLRTSLMQPKLLSASIISLKKQRFFCSDSEKKSLNDDLPDPTISNPYLKEQPQCILCKYNIEIDYKNVRLLSQFVSPYTGRIYDKHITGLCEKQHLALKKEFIRATKFGLMSPFYRDPKYNKDPKLFDPTRPSRPNPY